MEMIQYDYSYLIDKINMKCGSIKEFAKQMHMRTKTICDRLENRAEFTCNQIERAVDILDLSGQEISRCFFQYKTPVPGMTPEEIEAMHPETWTDLDRKFLDKAMKLKPEDIEFLIQILEMTEGHDDLAEYIEKEASNYRLSTPEGKSSFLAAIREVYPE